MKIIKFSLVLSSILLSVTGYANFENLIVLAERAKEESTHSKKEKKLKRLQQHLNLSRPNEIKELDDYLDSYFLRLQHPPGLDQVYDVVIVGAGVHGTIALFTLKKIDPSLSVLVVSSSDIPGGNFEQTGQGYYLNSPDYTFLSTNKLLNCFFQILDIAAPGYCQASQLSTTLKLNFYFHNQFLMGHKITGISNAINAPYQLITDRGLTIQGRSVIFATGLPLDRPAYGKMDQAALAQIERASGSPPNMEHYADFCKRIGASLKEQQEKRDPIAVYAGKRVAIVGSGGAAGTVLEALCDVKPSPFPPSENMHKLIPEIDWYVSDKFDSLDSYNQIFKNRFQSSLIKNGVPANIRNQEVVTLSVEEAQDGKKSIRIYDNQGGERSYDYVIFATGYNKDLLIAQETTDVQGNVTKSHVLQKFPVFDPQSHFLIAKAIQKEVSAFPKVLLVGPIADIEVSDKEIAELTGSSAASIELLAPRTVCAVAELVKELHRQ